MGLPEDLGGEFLALGWEGRLVGLRTAVKGPGTSLRLRSEKHIKGSDIGAAQPATPFIDPTHEASGSHPGHTWVRGHHQSHQGPHTLGAPGTEPFGVENGAGLADAHHAVTERAV